MTDQLLIESAGRLFADACTHAVVQDAERDGWAPTVWQSVADAGFPWVSIARKIDRGEAPAVESALVKEMGTRFEQDVLERVVQLVDVEPSPSSTSLFERLLASAILTGPSFTIRGGTIEVLRSVAAKGLES